MLLAKKLGIAGIAAATGIMMMANTVQAADYDMAPSPVGYDWSGAYIGVGLGWFSSRNKLNSGGPLGTWKPSSFAGGGYLGYNFGFDNLVFGVEGDIYALTGKKSVAGVRVRDYSTWSARGRLGYAIESFMPYITGGYAGLNQDVRVNGLGGQDKNLSGWTFGGGVEFLATPNWMVRGEYRYSDFGTNNWNIGGTPVSSKSTANEVIFGIAYKF